MWDNTILRRKVGEKKQRRRVEDRKKKYRREVRGKKKKMLRERRKEGETTNSTWANGLLKHII
jgi:hypothetical protein